MSTYLGRQPAGSQPSGDTPLATYLRDVVELGQRVADALAALPSPEPTDAERDTLNDWDSESQAYYGPDDYRNSGPEPEPTRAALEREAEGIVHAWRKGRLSAHRRDSILRGIADEMDAL